MKLKCYCTDDSVIELEYHPEKEGVFAQNRKFEEYVFCFAENECNQWDDEGLVCTRKVLRVMIELGAWYEIDSINKYPTYGVYYGDKFIHGILHDGDYVLMNGNEIHDDLWDENTGYFPAICDEKDVLLPYMHNNTWLGYIQNGEMVRVDDE